MPAKLTCDCRLLALLDCSEDLIQRNSCINQLRGQYDIDGELVAELGERLQKLSQHVEVREEEHRQQPQVNVDKTRIRRTADLYHLAALVYFERQIRRRATKTPVIQNLVQVALRLVSEMEVCTSPWPMFVIACEVLDDHQRLQVLKILTNMETQRRMGDISVTRMIVETLWKQQHLVLGEKGNPTLDWREIVNVRDLCPSFI